MNYWLVKQEPETYAWSQFAADGKTDWTGVRNYQARNHLRAMKTGDLALYYHSGGEKAVVGIARVSREAFADPTAGADNGDWSAVELEAKTPLKTPVPLAAIKSDPAFRQMVLVRNSRLSVQPVSKAEFERIVALGGNPVVASL